MLKEVYMKKWALRRGISARNLKNQTHKKFLSDSGFIFFSLFLYVSAVYCLHLLCARQRASVSIKTGA